jgi:hypothetical protein
MDTVTAIFARVASLRYPTAEEYETRVRNDVNTRLFRLSPKIIVAKADAAVSASKPIIADINAVNATFSNLTDRSREYIIQAVKAVYLPYKGKALIPNKIISSRVLAFATSNYCTPLTVYRWLKEARVLCAYYRGLTIEETEAM